MNAQRRKQIVKLQGQLEDISAEVQFLAGEEQEYYDNMPESFQFGEKGENAERTVSNLEEAVTLIDEAITQLTEACE
jgi:uncharacterized coiled-coil DUF342 family protein